MTCAVALSGDWRVPHHWAMSIPAMSIPPSAARGFWHVAEPLHAVVYFSPETAQAAKDAGLKGFWMGYFAGRAAPMGGVGPAVVGAAFYGFHPAMVARALPDAWAFCLPERVLETRMAAVTEALRRVLGELVQSETERIEQAAALAREACRDLDCAGRALAAAWAAVPWSGEALADLWLACTILREHRGDGHAAALVEAGLGGCHAHVLAAAAGDTPRQTLQPHRGWSDEDWQVAEADLRARGWLDADGRATQAGRQARAALERRTDELAVAPLARLGADRARELVGLLTPLSDAVRRAGEIPFPNPMGLPARADTP